MLYLKEALQNNYSIKTLYLQNNYLGCNENSLLYLKEALQNNYSIKTLHLQNNYLHKNENSLKKIRKLRTQKKF